MTDRALLIGIDEYPDPANNLNSCVADTVAFGELLGTVGFDDSEIHVLHNADATLAAARDGLDWLVDGAREGDRRVFFQSSHGYRDVRGDVMTEVLCMYDEFLEDGELAERCSDLPAGVLTVVLDSCHSGGMDKEFFVKGTLGVARTKVFSPPRNQMVARAKSVQVARALKPFGRTELRNEASMVSNMANSPHMVPSTKGAITGAVELNAVLLTACRADQTAAAGSEATDWLSAFTYALVNEMDAEIPVSALVARAVNRIEELNMSQSPCVFAPSGQQYRLTETFISGMPATRKRFAGAGNLTKEVKGMGTNEQEKAIQKAAAKVLADIKSASPSAGDKTFGYPSDGSWHYDAQLCGAVLAPAVAAVMPPPAPGKAMAPRPALTDPYQLDQKSFWSSAFNIARTVVGELTKSGAPAGKSAAPADPAELRRRIEQRVPKHRIGEPKFFGLVETLIGVAAPIIIDAVTKDFKPDDLPPVDGTIKFDLPPDLSEEETKSWFEDALDVVGDVLPVVVRALA
ncbi:caspase family protein [Streptomyces sp. NPDC046332]|uniref:caspase family protein n=1 Tax=Streptomyces sp. NPDC046332 TaxID=3155133 RepID=UPI0033DB77DD